MKTYKKYGKKFAITQLPKPSEDDVVYFTDKEYSWIKDQEKLWSPMKREEYFLFLWQAKKNDCNYQIVPDAPELNSMANIYCEQIKNKLRGKE